MIQRETFKRRVGNELLRNVCQILMVRQTLVDKAEIRPLIGNCCVVIVLVLKIRKQKYAPEKNETQRTGKFVAKHSISNYGRSFF